MNLYTPPTVVRVGLQKTATASLRMSGFRHGARPYFGLHGASGWETARRFWFAELMTGGQAAGGPFEGFWQWKDGCRCPFNLTSGYLRIERSDS